MTPADAVLPVIRPCEEGDASGLHAFVQALPPLTVHTPYTYWSLCRYASETCFVAESDGAPVGMVTGMVCASLPGTVFVWQLGVSPACRGTGLSDRLLDRIAETAGKLGAERLEFTIERDNRPSRRAFERLAQRHGSSLLVMGRAAVPGPIASDENPEVLYRIPLA